MRYRFEFEAARLQRRDEPSDGFDSLVPACCDPSASFDEFGNLFVGYINNDTNEARYNGEAAELAWGRTIGFFKKYLA